MATGLMVGLAVALGVSLCNHQSVEVGAVSLFGFVKLNSTEYGIKVKSDGTWDNTVYGPGGRYWHGPGERMIKIPAGNQTIQNHIIAKNSEGESVEFNYTATY